MVNDHQPARRRYLEQRCWIALDAGQPLIECYLQDISQTGAKLIHSVEKNVPANFDLYLTPDGQVGRKCKVAWQTENEVGLRFVGRTVPFRDKNDSPSQSDVFTV